MATHQGMCVFLLFMCFASLIVPPALASGTDPDRLITSHKGSAPQQQADHPAQQPSPYVGFSFDFLGGGTNGVAAFTGGGDTSIVCTCMCCLQGACVPVANATWIVPSCSYCTQADCLQRAADLDAMWSSETSRRRSSRSPCFVLHATEQKTCSGMSDKQCRRFTSIKPQCVQRSSLLQTLCCLGWTVIVIILVGHRLWAKLRNN